MPTPVSSEPRVGLVLVSHSRPLALAVKGLVESMTGPGAPLAVAAGAGPGHAELGTDAMEIVEAVRQVDSPAGVVVLMDMGSALLSAETALGFLDDEVKGRVRLCSAPFVEGAVAAGVIAHAGGDLDTVEREAREALRQKTGHLDAPVPQDTGAAAIAVPAGEIFLVLPVRNPHGLHSRPAAKLVKAAARFRAEIRVANATTGKGPVSAKSLSGIGTIEVLQGQDIRIAASGPDAERALQTLGELVSFGFGEGTGRMESGMEPGTELGTEPVPPAGGVLPVVEGIAIGPVFFLSQTEPEVPGLPAADAKAERDKLRQAMAAARAELNTEGKKARGAGGAGSVDRTGIFEAQALLLDDPALRDEAEKGIAERKASAPFAWLESVRRLRAQYEGLRDDYLRQRAADVADVGRRVLGHLGFSTEGGIVPVRPSILVCNDLTPSQAASLDRDRILGVICLDGGTTSHSAILLRALGIPGVAQARPLAARLREGATVALDGGEGRIWIDPDPEQHAGLERRHDAWNEARLRERAEASRPAVTADGHRIGILANVGGVDDARAAREAGAEGIGLLRTEFLFLNRSEAPTEEEQFAALRGILDAFGEGPVVVRTLDAGGDKELPYLGLPQEANPFLGIRAVRLSLRRPDLFRPHLRAILRAGEGRDLRVMFPMVTEAEELDRALALLEAAHAELEAEKVPHLWPVRCGIMIEVPAAALLADALARRAEFFSIGTNDLTQYTLAADRGNPELGIFQDALHPAVLALIAKTVEAARRHGREVAVCGEAAGDPVAALFLAGLGVGELSVTPRSVPRVKAALRAARLDTQQKRVAEALRQGDARAVRKLA